jgi:hypothetical protein
MNIMRGFGEVEKVFIYRLFDKGNGLGLVNSGFSPKPVYNPVKNFLAGNYGDPVVATEEEAVVEKPHSKEPPADDSSEDSSSSAVEAVKITADKDKTETRVDGTNIVADGKTKYRLVVMVKDLNGNIINSIKPEITASSGSVQISDPVLIGNEWFIYITSKEAGEKTLQIKAGGVDLGQIKMVFGEKTKKTEEPKITNSLPKETPKKNYLIWYISGGVLLVLLAAGLFFFIRYKK